MTYKKFIDLVELKNDDLIYTNSKVFADELLPYTTSLIYTKTFKNFLGNDGPDWIFSYDDAYYPFQYDVLKGVCILSHDLEYFKDESFMNDVNTKLKIYKIFLLDNLYFVIFVKR